jgi:hypothetical protein
MKGKPPIAVVIAALLLFAYGMLSLVRLWLFGSGLPTSPVAAAIWLLAIGLFAMLARALYLGRNWVRWLLTVAVALAVAIFPFVKPEMPAGPELVLYAMQILMPIVATALTFTARARAWFKA